MAKKYSKKRQECPSGKVRFRDHRQAVHALHGAQAARHRAESDKVETTHAAVRTYPCPACKGHHLTSKVEWGRAA